MKEWNCSVIKDLLPLYIDEVCSGESRKVIEEHLETCGDCQKALQQMRAELEPPAEAGDAQNGLRRIKKAIKKKYILFAVSAAAIVAICLGFSFCLQSIETPISYTDAKVSMVQDKKDPTQYNLTFNGQQYGCLYGEFINLKEDENTFYEAEIIHTVSTPWTRLFQRKPFEREVMASYSADPDTITGWTTDRNGTRKYSKTVAVYYQATPADDRTLLWMADWFKDMEQKTEQPQAEAAQESR